MPGKYPSKFISIIQCKCPRCRKGRVFPYSIFNPLKFSNTHDFCPHCHLKFEHETGFFWAAMYISYAFSTGIMLACGIVMIVLDIDTNVIFLALIPAVIILVPFSYRYSRIILLYFISPFRYF